MATRNYRTASGRAISETGLLHGEKTFVAIGQELYREMTDVLRESLPLVPVDTGALRGSGYVAEPERNGDHISCEVGYGGPSTKINPKSGEPTTAYALEVHENLQAHHVVGSAKYLQIPFDAATVGMGQRVADGVKRQLSGASSPAAQNEGAPD